jgi:YidC/Oxa1 family membrane protein insertase
MSSILRFALIFALSYAAMFLIFGSPQSTNEPEELIAKVQGKEIGFGKPLQLSLHNNTKKPIHIDEICPSNFIVERNRKIITLADTACIKNIDIETKKNAAIDIEIFQKTLNVTGYYFIKFDLPDHGEMNITFERLEQGFWSRLWDGLLVKPIFNSLLFLLDTLPGHSLGMAIILLTIFIRLLLLLPHQRALESQRKMQLIQPKIQELQKKYKNDKQKLAQETMDLFQKNNINPAGGCLPLLIQLPILLALYIVFLTGLSPIKSYLAYSAYSDFDFTLIYTNFLNILDLESAKIWWLALAIGIIQFIQMKLSFKNAKPKSLKPKGKEMPSFSESMAQASYMMMYILPIMITGFVYILPAAVGLYWGISTLFSVGQQIVVNKKHVTTKV